MNVSQSCSLELWKDSLLDVFHLCLYQSLRWTLEFETGLWALPYFVQGWRARSRPVVKVGSAVLLGLSESYHSVLLHHHGEHTLKTSVAGPTSKLEKKETRALNYSNPKVYLLLKADHWYKGQIFYHRGAWKHFIEPINIFVQFFRLFFKGMFLNGVVCRIVFIYLVHHHFSKFWTCSKRLAQL